MVILELIHAIKLRPSGTSALIRPRPTRGGDAAARGGDSG